MNEKLWILVGVLVAAMLVVIALALDGCAHEVRVEQIFADGTRISCIGTELNTSIRNSSVVASCIPQTGALGISPVVSIGMGTSVLSVAESAAKIAAKAGTMAKRPTPTATPIPEPLPDGQH